MYDVAKVCALNDEFRTSFKGGKVVVTPGVLAMPDMISVLDQVKSFNAFTPNNDPYTEHDFGAIRNGEHQIFWKIDYYDSDMSQGSPDPSDDAVTTRVLTVMTAEEY